MDALRNAFKKTNRETPPIGFVARLRRYFLAGILVTAPIGITLYLAVVTIRLIDRGVERFLPQEYNPETYIPFSIPGIGLVIVVVALTLIGWLMAGLLGRIWDSALHMIFSRIPIVRTFFMVFKQILETLLKDEAEAFKGVVLVEYPRKGIWSLGFITGKTQSAIQTVSPDEIVNVYVPTTPSPTAGYLLFVPRKDLTVLDMTVEQALKLIISAGMVGAQEGAGGAKPA